MCLAAAFPFCNTFLLCITPLPTYIGLQEQHAEHEAAAIRAMLSLQAVVLRGGVRHTVPADDLVAGDVILLSSGDKVPADARLFRATGLHTQESALTGETTVNPKKCHHVPADTPLGERVNMVCAPSTSVQRQMDMDSTTQVFSGTFVAQGQGSAIVVAIGKDTELGKVGLPISFPAELSGLCPRSRGWCRKCNLHRLH